MAISSSWFIIRHKRRRQNLWVAFDASPNNNELTILGRFAQTRAVWFSEDEPLAAGSILSLSNLTITLERFAAEGVERRCLALGALGAAVDSNEEHSDEMVVFRRVFPRPAPR